MADDSSEMSFEEIQSHPDDLESLATTESQWVIVDAEEEDQDDEDMHLEAQAAKVATTMQDDQPEEVGFKGPSARLVACGLVLLGNDRLAEVPGFRGQDLTSLCAPALQAFPAVNSACCLGRVAVLEGASQTGHLPLLAKVVVQNHGATAWPADACLQHVAGNPFGFDSLPIGALLPGQGAELTLDLALHVPEPMSGGW
eukprot:CAMPEP_0197627242 /NCGR_PEP_ID=MMETSP1338-20131121/5909_1 /TAXON_ID=43686 ORGANISM="Pelagodinium beii, Strain RCC1491" /NCGR_SAMPLE_ID=MMETSP1338 /ASSEMBLY_ACC=CAM_ASM_000754 /LENGTH=198 /DNA_ID=CAMNT_0043197915 /DNA_START=40 /DNA_END=633 /DNA_ORIENTATION=-